MNLGAGPGPNATLTDHGDGYKEDEPPSKRRRVALACNACRTRKSRCNGERPKCSLCRNLGFDCQYEPAESSTNVIVKKEYVSDFEMRLKSVEDLLRRHDDLLTGHLATCAPTADSAPTSAPRKASKPMAVEAGVKPPPLRKDSSIKLQAADLQDLPAEELVTDGMAMAFAAEHDCAYFGPSANIAFERHILRAMVAHNITNPKTFSVSHGGRALPTSGMLDYSRPPSPPSSPPPSHHGSIPGGRGGSLHGHPGSMQSRHGSMPSSFELPPVEEMEELMRTYFQHTGLLFPFIHEPSFMETYDEFKATGFTKVRRSWLGLLFVMLAMASVVDPGNREAAPARFEKSKVLNETGAYLCRFASVRGSSIEIVQYLLLASQYLQSTQKSSQTWMLHGLAVKGAFAIGLHSNQASQKYSALENEIRNRTFYGCVLLDRVLSMTFGRPPLIPEDYIRVSLARPWPDGPRPSRPDDDFQSPSRDFWNASIALHRLIGCTISRLYGNNLGWENDLGEHELVERMRSLDHDLQNWYRELPPGLPILMSNEIVAPKSPHERIVLRFRTMLTLRVHNLAILIHRPILSRSLDVLAETSEGAANAISQRSREINGICLGSAEETINIVYTILTDAALGPHALGAWWFTLFYIFNASLVVFSHSHIRRTTMELADGPAEPHDLHHLQRAIEALTLLDTDNRIIDRCIAYVQYLYKVLDRWNSRHSSGSSEQQQQLAALAQQDSGIGESATPQKVESRHPSASEGPLMPSIFSGLDNEMRDMSDYLKDDLELAQFFASGIFDMQNTVDGAI